MVAALVGFGSAGTYAYWSDTGVLTGGALASGTMDLRLDAGAVGLGTGYAKATIAVADLTPGEARSFDLSISNVGNPPFTWTATATRGASPTWTYLLDPVSVQVYAGTAVAGSGYPRVDSCSGAALGTAVTLTAASTSAITTAQTLAAGASQSVCLLVRFASSADNSNQGRTGSLSMTFSAAQVT
ncbi:unannotated protein [freshwater metagenome]|uniref:Unannotated protein n=1 Tax=freshwater metagenome TaxID=449393 RepID=A0A6J6R528_9ZZZZ